MLTGPVMQVDNKRYTSQKTHKHYLNMVIGHSDTWGVAQTYILYMF